MAAALDTLGKDFAGHTRTNDQPMRVLLVDDEQEICFLLSAMLRRQGIECDMAHSLSEARSKLDNGPFDAAFVDIHLPDGLGYELTDTIRGTGAKMIAISAVDAEGSKALQRGVDLFIAKPFDRGTIFGGLRQLHLIQ